MKYHLQKSKGKWLVFTGRGGELHSLWGSFPVAASTAKMHWLMSEQFRVLREHGLIRR